MIRNLKFLSFLLAFFLGSLFFPLFCNAQALPTPTVSSSTFEVITNTSETFYQLGFVPQGSSPFSDNFFSTWNPWNAGAVLLNFDLEDCNITELDDSQKTALLDSFSIIDSSNLTVTVDSPIYSVEFDNGYFTGYCYVDDQGNLLSYTNDLGGHLLQLKYGGSIKSSEDWQELFESTASKVYESNMVYFDNYNSGTLPDVSFYIMGGLGTPTNNLRVFEFYIPNQYERGVCVPYTSSNNVEINKWYCNGEPYIFRCVYGNNTYGGNVFSVQNGTYQKDGVSYTKLVTIGIANGAPNNTYADYIAGLNNNNRCLAHFNYLFNPSTYQTMANTTSEAFKPIQLPESAEIINYNYYYDPTAISKLEQELNNLTQVVNSSFNNQHSISENNFPFYYPMNDPNINPSNIPFPGVQNFPGFDPLPVPQLDPYLNYDTLTQPDYEEVNTSLGNYFIPYLENIFRRYPFSIPWDIKDFLTSFSAEPEPPSWDFDWTITIGNNDFTKHFEGDLSDFNGLAEIFRSLMLISFIFFLCKFSYDHHF